MFLILFSSGYYYSQYLKVRVERKELEKDDDYKSPLEQIDMRQKEKEIREEIIANKAMFTVGDEAYGMGFKALLKADQRELNLLEIDWHRALSATFFVFCLTITLLLILINTFGQHAYADKFVFRWFITMPSTQAVLIARFIVIMMMHMIVEVDMRQGLTIMKYCCNHPGKEYFDLPVGAFLVGFLQFSQAIFTEMIVIYHLSCLNDSFEIIYHFMALGKLTMIKNYYADALDDRNRIKGDTAPI